MQITATDVKNLREATGAGMMDCKKALVETEGNFDDAVDWLRKKGLAAASKKAGRTAADGVVGAMSFGTSGAVVEINAETDFVARNEKFQALANKALDLAGKYHGDQDKMLNTKTGDATLQEEITSSIAVIGENIQFRRAAYVAVNNGVVESYTHNAITENLGKISVLVALESSADKSKLQELAKKIAMHIAAMKPESLDIAGVDAQKVEKEKEIFREQALASGKPEQIIDKMVEGRVRKYYDEVVLLEQVFVLDDAKRKMSQYLDDFSKDIGSEVKLTNYVRYELGEGIEKESNDFASEVASMVK
jgi:elongation factor Ts